MKKLRDALKKRRRQKNENPQYVDRRCVKAKPLLLPHSHAMPSEKSEKKYTISEPARNERYSVQSTSFGTKTKKERKIKKKKTKINTHEVVATAPAIEYEEERVKTVFILRWESLSFWEGGDERWRIH